MFISNIRVLVENNPIFFHIYFGYDRGDSLETGTYTFKLLKSHKKKFRKYKHK